MTSKYWLQCHTLNLFLVVSLIVVPVESHAGLLERYRERQQQTSGASQSHIQWDTERPESAPRTSTSEMRKLADVAYGSHPMQRMDVFLPATAHNAPVIIMVHGGGWRRGDKSMRRRSPAKQEHYVEEKGYIYISINYRLAPEVTPLEEADDVAAALAFVQRMAPQWGADPDKIMLMGHSAGAHLVTLLAVDPDRAYRNRARRWAGSIAIDSGAMDVPSIMNRRHPSLYDKAFGEDPALWEAASPRHQVRPGGLPVLAICSSTRADNPCEQARNLAETARQHGVSVSVLPQPLNHGKINSELGKPGDYTSAVDAFIAKHVSR